MAADAWNQSRFVAAQAATCRQALAEVTAGLKESHWMWIFFPQIAGLGHCETARRYAISGHEEALAYLAHPLLGPRLRGISQALLTLEHPDPHRIFGSPDDLKLHSSMTLFAAVAPDDPVFTQVLGRFFRGRSDPRTLERLAGT